MEWAYSLHGRSGVGMSGFAPVTYTTIEAWARLMDIGELEPYEVDALLVLDAALLSDDETDKDDPVILPASRPSWPTKKAPPEET